jgi:hypothetical protein
MGLVPDERRDSGIKWRRGSQHFEWLESEWKAYMPRFQSDLRVVPISGGVELRLGKISDPPGKDWSPVIGDCVQNFRSALDHMVWQLAPTTAREANPSGLEFPIFSNSTKYANGAASRIGTLSGAAQKVIDSVQPFHSREYIKDPLWQLHTLSNIDKHRRLHVGDVSLEALTLDVKGTRLQTVWQAAPPATRARQGMVLARVMETEIRRFGEPSRVQVQPSAFLTIAFEDSEEVTGEGVIGTLRSIRDRVGVVLDELEACIALI